MTKLWNIAHYFANHGGICHKISRFFELLNFMVCANGISAYADIGRGTKFFHCGLGCVIHPRAIISKGCKIFQNVTIGSKWSDGECEGAAPIIGDNVFIGAGSVILGDIRIGDGVIIGCNAVVINDIPSGEVVGGIPARSLKKKEQ